eukprot:s2478_g16.t1
MLSQPRLSSEPNQYLQEHAEHLQELVNEGKLDGELAESFLADPGAKHGDLAEWGLRGSCRPRFMASMGPDQPQVQAAGLGLPRWPAGWHDMLQYHFFFEDMFVQARVFLTPSVEEHSLWIFDHATEKLVELLGPGEVMGNSEQAAGFVTKRQTGI